MELLKVNIPFFHYRLSNLKYVICVIFRLLVNASVFFMLV